MKKTIKSFIAASALVLAFNAASAQQSTKEETAPWTSDKGYWVIESNVKTPLQHTVRFYNADDALVYAEKIEGVRLNANKRKVKMKLKAVLEQSVTAWEQNKVPVENKNYVTAVLR